MHTLSSLVSDLLVTKAASRKQIAAENALNRKLVALFSKVEEEVLRELMQRGTPSNPVALRRMLASMEGASEAYTETILPEMEQMAVYGRNRVVNEMQNQGVKVSFQAAPELTKDMREKLRKTVFEASQVTLRRMTGNVMQQLSESYNQGLGIDDAASQLKKVFTGMKDYELRRVARTEINSAQNYGAEKTIEQMHVDYHQWWSTDDDRTRDSHVDIHGQIVRVGELFSNGLHYPGDKSGDIEEWINCRCRIIPFIMPEGKKAPVGQAQFYESDLR